MKSLDLIIETALTPQLNTIAINRNANNTEKYIRVIKFLQEYHETNIGPLKDVELKALNEQVVHVDSSKLTPVGTTVDVAGYKAKNAKKILDIVKKSEKVRKELTNTSYNFISGNVQGQIIQARNTGKLDSVKFNKWTNKTADAFFQKIITQDPNYKAENTQARLNSGYVFDKSNANHEWYDYEILCTDDTGRSVALMRFDPNGTVKIMPDTLSTVNAFTYKVIGNKISVYSTMDSKEPILTGTQNDYTIMFKFNNKFLSADFDPYKGAGFLRSLWLDLTGVKRKYETKFKNQKEYEHSWDKWQDRTQSVLDWLGLIPGYGDIIDLINGIWYFARGKNLQGVLSFIAIIPVVGSVITRGFKASMQSLKLGGKTGINALEAIFSQGPRAWLRGARETLVEYFRRNRASRAAVRSFISQIGPAITSGLASLRNVVRNLRGRSLVGWVGRVIDDLVNTYGRRLLDWADNLSHRLEDVLRAADNTSDLVVAGSKVEAEVVGYVANRSIRQVLKGLTVQLADNASRFIKFLYNVVGKKWFDAFGRSMIDSFIQYVKRQPARFFTALATTTGGARILVDAATNYFSRAGGGRLLVEYLLQNGEIFQRYLPDLYERFGGRAINNLTEQEITQIVTEWGQVLVARITQDAGPQLRQLLNDLILQPLSRNVDALNKVVDEALIDCIREGNAMYKIWCMSFWNKIRAALPGRIMRFYDATKIIFVRYDFKGGKIFELEGTVGKWVKEAFEKSPILNKYIGGLIRGFLRILDGLLNLKRLDVFYNEFQDFFEKIGVDSDNVDEKQGVIASTLLYIMGTWPFDLIKGLIGFGSEVITPSDLGQDKSIPEIPMVKNQRFKTKTK